MQDESVVGETIIQRITKPVGKYLNNYDIQDNTSNEVIRDYNFNTIELTIDTEADIDGEKREQLAEGEIHKVFEKVVEKEIHGEQLAIEAKKKELETVTKLRTYEEV